MHQVREPKVTEPEFLGKLEFFQKWPKGTKMDQMGFKTTVLKCSHNFFLKLILSERSYDSLFPLETLYL